MSVKCGIIGLPNVGKSTLFNLLTRASIEAANYPFCTIEPNTGMVTVPNPRLAVLEKLTKPQQVLPAYMQFVDIAGLVRGASKGEGLGNQFLAHIRETNANIHVVRCFKDDNVSHIEGNIDPVADIETVETELCLADMQTLEKMLIKLNKGLKTGDDLIKKQHAVLQRALVELGEGHPPDLAGYNSIEQVALHACNLLTCKPTLYVANIDDYDLASPYLNELQTYLEAKHADYLAICVSLEAEIAELPQEEGLAFLADLGLEEPGLHRLIRAAYQLLGQQTFFTVGPKELRAWTIRIGTTAQQAAGVIHTDFANNFIRAEVISYQDFIQCGSEQEAKQKGHMRLEGKDYIVQDSDVIYFRTNC